MSAGGFRVVWRLYPNLDLLQMSGLLSGLVDLSRRGLVSVHTRMMTPSVDLPYSAMELEVQRVSSGERRNLVLDFYDRADRVVFPSLEFADAYFKRQCGPETRRAVPESSRKKIHPLGLTVPGFSVGSLRLVAPAILATLRSQESHRPRRRLAAVAEAFSGLSMWAAFPHPDSARRRERDVKRPGIVFQPRLWSGDPACDPIYEQANAERLALVGSLREAFPDEPAIGLVHGALAQHAAPDLMLRTDVKIRGHRRQLRKSTIAIHSAGLSGCVGWKFSEYLAAGNAIVSNPIGMEYPEPIEPGIHYLPYSSPEECVEQCRRLLADPALADRMGKVNREYYARWIHPPAQVLSLLQRAFE